jgi:hypothetical protein
MELATLPLKIWTKNKASVMKILCELLFLEGVMSYFMRVWRAGNEMSILWAGILYERLRMVGVIEGFDSLDMRCSPT